VLAVVLKHPGEHEFDLRERCALAPAFVGGVERLTIPSRMTEQEDAGLGQRSRMSPERSLA